MNTSSSRRVGMEGDAASGAPYWYEGGRPHEGKARKKSLAGYRGRGSEVASASADSGKEGSVREARGGAVKAVVEKTSATKNSITLSEQIGALHRVLD